VKSSSAQIRKSHEAISLFATVKGFFVDINNPEKNDCEIPIYNTGSIFIIDDMIIITQI
jgi:hypothetical protein